MATRLAEIATLKGNFVRCNKDQRLPFQTSTRLMPRPVVLKAIDRPRNIDDSLDFDVIGSRYRQGFSRHWTRSRPKSAAKAPLRGDRRRVDILVKAARAVEAGVERARASAPGLRVPGYVRTVIVARGVGRPDRVPLVSP